MIISNNKKPIACYVAQGSGESDVPYPAASYNQALHSAGLTNCTPLSAPLFLSKEFKIVEKVADREEFMTQALLSAAHATKGKSCFAGLVIGHLVRKKNRDRVGSLVCEFAGSESEPELKEALRAILQDLYEARYADEHDLDEIIYHITSVVPTKEHGASVIALCLVEYQCQLETRSNSYPPFFDHQTTYEKARYVIQPVPYEQTTTLLQGCKYGASAILEASLHIEDYDIVTDSQVYKKGIATLPPLHFEGPEELVQGVKRAAQQIFRDDKFPIFLGGEHAVSIGVFYALKECYGDDFTILQLDSHTDLRLTYKGTPYSQACVMTHAKKCTDSLVQWGIRSMSNREKNLIDFDKTFFAMDIHENDHWLEDTLIELKSNVYITLDVSVLDPIYTKSTSPEPYGVTPAQLFTLIKAVAKRHNIIGLDIVELVPTSGDPNPDALVAKLIYQTLSLRESYESRDKTVKF